MQIISGVGLILFEPKGKTLVLRELKSKPHYGKYAGMLSIPLETIEDGETKESALKRLMHEEIGEEIGKKIAVEVTFLNEFFIELSATHSVRLFIFTGIAGHEFVARPNDTDVEYYGWMSLRDIMQLNPKSLRQEIMPICVAMNAR
jgi:8-oxo-dGTP pyrophosphatase MutT (NUDIX family)